jgi:hypothetical protein
MHLTGPRPNQILTSRRLLGLAGAIIALLLSWHCGGADHEPELSAEQIILRYLEVTGLQEHASQFQNRVTVGKFLMPKIGYEGEVTTYTVPPDFRRMDVLQGSETIYSSGVKDGIAWTIDPIDGARIMEGLERLRALRQCTFDTFLSWQLDFVSAEVKRTASESETTHHRVILSSLRGERLIALFDRQSGLLTRMISQAGSSRISVDVSDYREVDGMLIPHLLDTDLDGAMTLQIAATRIEHNVEIPEELLALPQEILKLEK